MLNRKLKRILHEKREKKPHIGKAKFNNDKFLVTLVLLHGQKAKTDCHYNTKGAFSFVLWQFVLDSLKATRLHYSTSATKQESGSH